jgi:hypothetical protein
MLKKIVGAHHHQTIIIKSTNQNEHFPKKNYVSYLKSVKEPKIRIGAPRRNLQAQPKMLKKIVGTSNQPIRTKIFP